MQAWEDAGPANLTTVDQVWKGEMYNDSEFTAGLFVDGTTTDATRRQWLTAAAGQSFQDHASVRTNALTYDQSKGVGIKVNQLYGGGFIDIRDNFFKLTRLQFQNTSSNGGVLIEQSASLGEYRDLILVGTRTASSLVTVASDATNLVVVQLGAGDALETSGVACYGCTIAKPSNVTASGTGLITTASSATVALNCAVFGFSTASSGTFSGSSSNNATNLGAGLPGTANQYSVSYSSSTPFVGAASSALDLRAVAATALAGNGAALAGIADISATTRAAAPTIGAWELASASSALSVNVFEKISVTSFTG